MIYSILNHDEMEITETFNAPSNIEAIIRFRALCHWREDDDGYKVAEGGADDEGPHQVYAGDDMTVIPGWTHVWTLDWGNAPATYLWRRNGGT